LIDTEVASPPRISEHLAPDVLRDFMAGKLPWETTRRVVRHLLAGCRRCSEVTGQIWDFAEEELDPAYEPCEEGSHGC
jgi:hypothetical protein